MTLKGFRPVFAILLVLSVVSFALAWGAPTKQRAYARAAAVASVNAAPVVTSVPPMTVGFDVICNLSQSTSVDTSAWLRLISPVDWRSRHLSYANQHRPAPRIVLLA